MSSKVTIGRSQYGYQKRQPKKNSVKVYAELIIKYDIHLSCDGCLELTPEGHASIKQIDHDCKKNALILFNKGSSKDGFQVRKKPRSLQHKFGLHVCEHVAAAENCPERQRCDWPHCDLEKRLWERELDKELNVASLIEDLNDSHMRIRHFVEYLCRTYRGMFKFICGKCDDKGAGCVGKKKHNPVCANKHSWSRNKCLAFVFNNAGYLRIKEFQDDQDLTGDEKYVLNSSLWLLNLEETDEENIEEAIVQLSVNYKASLANHQNFNNYNIDAEDNNQPESLLLDADLNVLENTRCFVTNEDEIYDNDIDDLQDSAVYNADSGDRPEKLENIKYKGNTGKYYELKAVNEAIALAEIGPPYFRAIIELKGPFDAVCHIIGDRRQGNEIEIKGRINCGSAFSGDEVIVQEKNVSESEHDGLVIRGSVVAVVKRNTHRVARTFVCRVDRIKANLMQPYCESLPKIRIVDTFVQNHIKNKKHVNNYIAVYDENLSPRKMFKLDLKRRENMIFIVKYLKWDEECRYPLGYCCRVLRQGDTIERSQKILNAIYEVRCRPTKMEDNDDSSVNEKGDSVSMVSSEDPRPLSSDKENCASELNTASVTDKPQLNDSEKVAIISIDPKGSEDFDDAIGIQQLEDDKYEISVHIADVSSVVKSGSNIDQEALNRTQTYYPVMPNSRPYHMLPAGMVEKSLSLVEQKRRRVMSVIFTMTEAGVVVDSSPRIEAGSIIVDKNLTYEEAQIIIDGDVPPRNLEPKITKALMKLYIMSKHLRQERLNDGQYYYEYDRRELSNSDSSWFLSQNTCYDSRRLVEEFMILTNRHIAEFLISAYPFCTPLRTQAPPKTSRFENWKNRNKDILPLSFYFKQFELLKSSNGHHLQNSQCNIPIVTEAYDALLSAIKNDDFKVIERIVGTEMIHPLHAIAITEWFSIQEYAKYSCSSGETNKSNSHFSLQLDNYVQFTSPIRRYLDIVVHRLVKSALAGKDAGYTSIEIQDLCQIMTQAMRRGKGYDRACSLLKVASALEEPRYLPCFINEIDTFGMLLNIPQMVHGKQKQRKILFANLAVDKIPTVQENKVKLEWKKRMYDTRQRKTPGARPSEDSGKCMQLDENMHGVKISGSRWSDIQNRIKSGEINRISQNLFQFCENIQYSSESESESEEIDSKKKPVKKRKRFQYNVNITSEVSDDIILRHFVHFNLALSKGSVMNVQFGRSVLNGSLTPEIKVANLTHSVDICTEHKQNPIGCFSAVATRPRKENYDNIDEYQEIWLAILDMESATNASRSEDSLICNHIPIIMEKQNKNFFGRMTLDEEFCVDRKIRFSTSGDWNEATSDYLCIKFSYKASGIRCLWVGHGLIIDTKRTSISKREFGRLKVKFKITHFNFPPPEQLYNKLRPISRNCSLEFLPRNISDRRMIEAVSSLLNPEISMLCRNIALGRQLKMIREIYGKMDHSILFSSELKDKFKDTFKLRDLYNNKRQEEAIKESLRNQFTLIQGPPGTGKTEIGVKIAYWFVKYNNESREFPAERKQVLCCGPSNSSVNVIAEQMIKKLGCNLIANSPKIVRVYSEVKENQDYPIPRDVFQKPSKRKFAPLPKEFCLHHIIRQSGKPHSEALLHYKELFELSIINEDPTLISERQIKNYQKLVLEASIEEMKQYDVILCTCSASSSARFKRGAKNVKQIIIDECAMSMEPNSMVAISNFQTAEQVVLIGDHKQLRPIVMNKDAAELGLEVSLFERYAKKYQRNFVMLNKQYRMRKEICEFPSNYFYEGKLKTAENSPWFHREDHFLGIWPNNEYPMVFCHVEGIEKSQSVTTVEGSEQSKSNQEECHHVCRFARELINTMSVIMGRRYPTPQENIAILTQYNAQRAAIVEELKLDGFTDVTVSTVVASQGDEWDYVILSTVRSVDPYELEPNATPGWVKSKLGFVADPNQINVAITRARQGLIIVGNKNLLRCDQMWRNLIEFYEKRGCVVEAKDFLNIPLVPGPRNDNIPRFQKQRQQGLSHQNHLLLHPMHHNADRK